MTSVSILPRFQDPYVIAGDPRELLELLVLLGVVHRTLLVLYVDEVSLGDCVKYVHSLLLVVLFQGEEEARFRGDQIDPIDVVVELIKGELSQDLDSPKLRPK